MHKINTASVIVYVPVIPIAQCHFRLHDRHQPVGLADLRVPRERVAVLEDRGRRRVYGAVDFQDGTPLGEAGALRVVPGKRNFQVLGFCHGEDKKAGLVSTSEGVMSSCVMDGVMYKADPDEQ